MPKTKHSGLSYKIFKTNFLKNPTWWKKISNTAGFRMSNSIRNSWNFSSYKNKVNICWPVLCVDHRNWSIIIICRVLHEHNYARNKKDDTRQLLCIQTTLQYIQQILRRFGLVKSMRSLERILIDRMSINALQADKEDDLHRMMDSLNKATSECGMKTNTTK